MATNSIPKSDVAYMESPASWNTRYVTPEGFTCQITIRGENGKDLLDKAGVALSYLLEHGFKPEENHQHSRKAATKSSASSGKRCDLHNCELMRFEKDGRVWFSHKTDDGNWCRGKQKDN